MRDSPWARHVTHLCCLRGIDTLSVLGLCAEVGDFEGFQRSAQLMSCLGPVPSENSSGERRRQLDHQVGLPPRPPALGRGGLALPPVPAKGSRVASPPGGPAPGGLRDLLAPNSAFRSWVRLDSERGKRRTLCAVAVARELSGFYWAVAIAD